MRAKDNEERTPIHLACTDNKIDTVQVLFEQKMALIYLT